MERSLKTLKDAVNGKGSAPLPKENVRRNVPGAPIRKIKDHCGIPFKAAARKETVVKPFSFDRRPRIEKGNNNVLPVKTNEESKDGKNIKESKPNKTDTSPCPIEVNGPQRRVLSRAVSFQYSKIQKESIKAKNVLSTNSEKPSPLAVASNTHKIISVPSQKQRLALGAHGASGLKFHGNPRKETKTKPFSFQIRSEQKPLVEHKLKREENGMKQHVPKKLNERREAIDGKGDLDKK